MSSSRKKSVYIAMVALGILTVAIAYVSLMANAKVGKAIIKEEKEETKEGSIYFDNWVLDTNDIVNVGDINHKNTAVYPSTTELSQLVKSGTTKIEGLNVKLHQPGDYVYYTFQIVNGGSKDLTLDKFDTSINCYSGDCSPLLYSVDCSLSEKNWKSILYEKTKFKHNAKMYCKLEVKYDDQASLNTTSIDQNEMNTIFDISWLFL